MQIKYLVYSKDSTLPNFTYISAKMSNCSSLNSLYSYIWVLANAVSSIRECLFLKCHIHPVPLARLTLTLGFSF